MTDQERYEVIGKVVSDHEKAKKDLAVLQAKARSLSEFLHYVIFALDDDATWLADGASLTISRRNIPGPLSGEWPTREAVVELLSAIRDTKTTIKELGQRRAELGV